MKTEKWVPVSRGHLDEDQLSMPDRWRTPRLAVVEPDLFAHGTPDEVIARVWNAMTRGRHVFQVVTEHPRRMRDWVSRCKASPGGWITHDGTDPAGAYDGSGLIVGYPRPRDWDKPRTGPRGGRPRFKPEPRAWGWPLPNVWLGIRITGQAQADHDIPFLLATPAAVRCAVARPLTAPLSLGRWLGSTAWPNTTGARGGIGGQALTEGPGIDWVVAGAEDDPVHPDWARRLRDECQAARIPFTFTGWGRWQAVPVVDDPRMFGGRAFDNPGGGRTSASIRERSARGFAPGVTRLMKPGDENGVGVLLDRDTMAVRLRCDGGRELDGRIWDERPGDRDGGS